MAYVINLDSRPERLRKFVESNGDIATRVQAVNNPEKPACGCMNSHLKVLEIAKQDNLDHVIVFEDDAMLRERIECLDSLIEALSEKHEWDVLLFSISYGAHLFYTYMGELHGKYSYVQVNDFFNGTYCMAVSERAYDRVIQMIKDRQTEDIEVDTDIYSKLCDDCNVFLTLPFVADTISDQSDIRKYDTGDDNEKIRFCEGVLMVNNNLW
jgi:GR25 family glycosyltransferase involved in LPS biosynthesis